MSNTLFQWEQRGSLRTMQSDGTGQEGECHNLPENQLVLMGSGITNNLGEWTFNVSPALCVPLHAVDWVSLVATPSLPYNWDGNGRAPSPPLWAEYVTTAWSANAAGLTLYVKSWQSNGENKAGVPFSWHAAVMHHLAQQPG
jgi:hypothetical protein